MLLLLQLLGMFRLQVEERFLVRFPLLDQLSVHRCEFLLFRFQLALPGLLLLCDLEITLGDGLVELGFLFEASLLAVLLEYFLHDLPRSQNGLFVSVGDLDDFVQRLSALQAVPLLLIGVPFEHVDSFGVAGPWWFDHHVDFRHLEFVELRIQHLVLLGKTFMVDLLP